MTDCHVKLHVYLTGIVFKLRAICSSRKYENALDNLTNSRLYRNTFVPSYSFAVFFARRDTLKQGVNVGFKIDVKLTKSRFATPVRIAISRKSKRLREYLTESRKHVVWLSITTIRNNARFLPNNVVDLPLCRGDETHAQWSVLRVKIKLLFSDFLAFFWNKL